MIGMSTSFLKLRFADVYTILGETIYLIILGFKILYKIIHVKNTRDYCTAFEKKI